MNAQGAGRTGLAAAARFVRMVLVCSFAAAIMNAPARADLLATLPKVKQSVVGVGTYQRPRSPAFQFRGTGFVVGDGRHIVTNAHVLPDVLATDQMETLVIVVPGKDNQATVRQVSRAGSEPSRDLAVLRLQGEPALPALALAAANTVREGQEVAFTGFPIGAVLGMTPVTHRGIVSAITPIGIPQRNARDLDPALLRRLAKDMFRVYQLDATAYPGNSGSPLFDPVSGQVLGVINMVLVKSTKENVLSDPSGISYAIPVEHLQTLLRQLR